MSTQPDPEVSTSPVAAVVVLAAGGGTRMKSNTSKLLHQVCGRSMLHYAVNAAEELNPQHLVVVVGHRREQVTAHLADFAPNVTTAVQEEQNGTGHAVQCGLADLGDLDGEVVVTYGDVPLLTGETLQALVASHREQGSQVTVLTAHVPDPTGYGRVIREGGRVLRIVEQKDATPEEAAVDEINSGIYVFDAATLRHGLANLKADNAQGELYLTDVIKIANDNGQRVGSFATDDLWQTEGVNDRVQLARMNAEMNRRIVEKWMRAGVTVLDPATTWIQEDVELAQDVTVLPHSSLEGATSVATGAVIGPETTLCNAEVGENARITRSHVEFAVVGAGVVVGPYAHLRAGSQLGDQVRVNSFVETRNVTLAPGTEVPPLTVREEDA